MKKAKRFKIEKHKRYDKQKYNNLTYYEDFQIRKIKTQRLQEYGVLSLIGLLGIMFLVKGQDIKLLGIENDPEKIMTTIGGLLTSSGVIGTGVNILRNGDRTDELRRLKKRREEVIEFYNNLNRRK